LRLLALIAEAMHRVGDTEPERHVVVLEEPQYPDPGPPMASLLWSRRPFSAEALERLRAATAERQKIAPVKVLCWPGETHDNPLSQFLRSPDRERFLREYPYEVSAVTDDRPFLFHTVRFGDLIATAEKGVENEDAVQVLGTVLVTVLAITLLAFLLPMAFALRGRGSRGKATLQLTYFCCLGVGFMLVEIPMLQRFSLYVGHPTWTLSTVLGSLLLGAGCGGMRTTDIRAEQVMATLRRTLLLVLVALIALVAASPWLLSVTLTWPFPLRVLLTVAVLAPLGWPLGQALPLGIKALHGSGSLLVPWAWGLNGAASVLASVLAVAIGMQFGFTAALGAGIGCYLFALLLHRRLDG
ncbi:MAG: hypothetical protein ACKVQR_08580, partial [Aquabacterium sp.]